MEPMKPTQPTPAARPIPMSERESEVLAAWSPSPTTRAVRLRRPPGFAFTTSQAVRLVLAGSYRPLSLASAPTREHLELAVRRSDSDFKRAFFALAPGDRVRFVGPGGHFLLERARPAVMIAGGIGITPFKSMLETATDERMTAPLRLVWANRDGDVPFADEIARLAAAAPDASVRHVAGRLEPGLVARLAHELPEAVFYLAGPAGFVRAAGVALLGGGVPRERVRMEMFRGYADDADAGGANDSDDSDDDRPGPPSWDAIYAAQPAERMPWFYGALDPELARELDARGLDRGRFLDVGAGPGTQAIALAARGFDVTATDLSPAAVAGAAERARAAGARVDFRVDDVLASSVDGRFDFVLDRGCFHVIPARRRGEYVAAVARWLAPGGLLFLKCFADDGGGLGPYHFTPQQIAEIFAPAFDVLSTERSVIQGTLSEPPRALFCVLRRRRA